MSDVRTTTPGYGSARDLPSFIEMRRQLAALGFASLLLMPGRRREIAKLKSQLEDMSQLVDEFYNVLGPCHWVFNDWMNPETIRKILHESVDAKDAEQRIIMMFQDAEATKFHLRRLQSIDGLKERQQLLLRARKDYDANRFESCTLLLVSVMDGFVNDFDVRERKGLAARKPEDMLAWDSVTGHHLGLAHALQPFFKTIKKRIDEEVFEVHRHGIVHGSVVNYNNAVVATKAWNLLFAVVDWSIATKKKAEHDARPATPSLRESIQNLASYAQKKKARRDFVSWTAVASDDGFEKSDVVIAMRTFVEGWQKKRWGLLIPFVPGQLVGQMTKGEAVDCIKRSFGTHEISGVVIDRVEYVEASVAEVRGSATIDGIAGSLRLSWVHYDSEGNLALNDDEGDWRLAVIAPHTYLIDDE